MKYIDLVNKTIAVFRNESTFNIIQVAPYEKPPTYDSINIDMIFDEPPEPTPDKTVYECMLEGDQCANIHKAMIDFSRQTISFDAGWETKHVKMVPIESTLDQTNPADLYDQYLLQHYKETADQYRQLIENHIIYNIVKVVPKTRVNRCFMIDDYKVIDCIIDGNHPGKMIVRNRRIVILHLGNIRKSRFIVLSATQLRLLQSWVRAGKPINLQLFEASRTFGFCYVRILPTIQPTDQDDSDSRIFVEGRQYSFAVLRGIYIYFMSTYKTLVANQPE